MLRFRARLGYCAGITLVLVATFNYQAGVMLEDGKGELQRLESEAVHRIRGGMRTEVSHLAGGESAAVVEAGIKAEAEAKTEAEATTEAKTMARAEAEAKTDPAPETSTEPALDDMHIVFSTSCNEFQHWQTEVLLNTALRVGQRGNITHIVVGCEEREDAGMHGKRRHLTHPAGAADNIVSDELWRRSSNDRFNLFYAPAVPEAKEFPWFNKPWSFYHWAQHARPRERAIVILDPDEFFLEPLTQGRKPPSQLINTWPAGLPGLPAVTDLVQPGLAVAQRYGLGNKWLSMFNRTKICGPESYCASMGKQEADLYYSVGPPYLIHQRDFKPIMDLWWERFMKPAYAEDKGDIQVDMYAYIMAAAHLQVKHVRLEHYMVSCPRCNGEWWAFVDAMTMSCRAPAFPEGTPKPTFLHSAQHYYACSGGETPSEDHRCKSEMWNMHKGHVPSTILECDQPLLVPPPDDLFNVQNGTKDRRNAFMICFLTKMINDAVLDYKKKFCRADELNEEMCVRIALSGDDEYPKARRVCGKRGRGHAAAARRQGSR